MSHAKRGGCSLVLFLKNLLRQLLDAGPLALADKAYLDHATGLGDLERRMRVMDHQGSMNLFFLA